jgi:hypothetical protein
MYCSAFIRTTRFPCIGRDKRIHSTRTLVSAKTKNGGKPKQPKQEPENKTGSPTSASSQSADAAAAARVRTDIGMSVKTQIRLLQAMKEAERRSTRTVTRTSFRREKPVDGGAAAGGGDDDTEWTGSREPPLYLVDGYNVIGHWPRLRK